MGVKWTTEQLNAIQTKGKNILVAAAAGSGKTAVLVERIINKIINEKIDIDELLVVTFTNAAASEMRERILDAIYKKLEEDPENYHLQKQINIMSRANICTIDSFCLDVVKNNFYEIDISPNFRIADTTELDIIKQEVLEELFDEKYEVEDSKFINLLETYTTYSDDNPLKELILNIYNFIQSAPFPMEFLDAQVEKYDLKDKLEDDFSQNAWGDVILNELKENLTDAKLKLEVIKKSISKYDEMQKYSLVFGQDINQLESILKLEKWDEIYNAISQINFERWPTDKKISLEEKEIAKEKRNEIKKQINESLKVIDCNSKQANEDIYYMYETLKALEELIIQFDVLLKTKKKEKNIVDFSDIEHMALDILLDKEKRPSEVAKKLRKKFKEIAIDEYQDSNLVQEYILTSISNGNNIFMVGDVKQSIYKFRQARPELFLEKYRKYKNIDKTDSEGIRIQLFKNFRSRENILDTTNIIFKDIMSKKLGDIDYSKEEYLNLGATYEETKTESIKENTKIFLIENKDSEEENIEDTLENIELEAKFIAKKIKELISSGKTVFDKRQGYRTVTYKDIVILLRSTKDKANIFENELTNVNIPVYSDTSSEYLNSIEIQTIMSLLKVIDNPMVDIPLVSVLRSIIGKFNDDELVQIRLTNSKKTFYESMLEYREKNQESILSQKIGEFLQKIEDWKEESQYLELDEFIWKIYIDTGYYNYVTTMPDGILRAANLKLLFEKAKQYERMSFNGLYNFINFIEKVKNSSGDLSSAKLIGENENVVRIMSIHKSKGLEFPIVFLSNTNKKFNLQDLNSDILLHQELGLGVKYIDLNTKVQYSSFAREAIKIKARNEAISEEMRILYVALTRAKETLIITGVTKDIKKQLKEKQEIIETYTNNEKINISILKKYKSYLDWLELIYFKNKESNIINIEEVTKEEIIGALESEMDKTPRQWQIKENFNKSNLDEIKNKLNWQYKFLSLSKVEGKSSVSKLKQEEGQVCISQKVPNFMKEQTKKLSGAQKGTLIHLCMQNLSLTEEYNNEKIHNLIQSLKAKRKISDIELENIDSNKILNFTNNRIWKEVRKAKLVEREKPFYISLPINEVYDIDEEENILVQGIIDLYYINEEDELVLVDYKTDYVTNEKELIDKYNKQLQLYKRALEASLNRKVDKVYIYSTHLNKEIDM